MSAILYYFHDPMCSWCYAFQPTWQTIKNSLPAAVDVTYVLGGLAPDDDEPMPEALQQTIQHHWQRIQQVVPGTRFNFDFWTLCKPRRATYPACRAVVAAAVQGTTCAESMIQAIQRGFYREARNPSDYATHEELARELQLDVQKFQHDLVSVETERELMRQIGLTQAFNVQGFPSLVLTLADQHHAIPVNYTSAESSLEMINGIL